MHTATLRTVGGSVSVTLPRQMLSTFGLSPSVTVAVTVEDGWLVLSHARPRYTLTEHLLRYEARRPAYLTGLGGCAAGGTRSLVSRRALYDPKRCDIIRLDFDPSAGHEQQCRRPALVLSPEPFDRLGMTLACPVTRGGSFARGKPWTVSLAAAGLQTDRVVLCNQVRTVDLKALRAELIEAAPPGLVDADMDRWRQL